MLSRKDQPFLWNEACQTAFETLKDRITTAPALRHFNAKRQAILETDSSEYVTRGILL